MKKIIAILTILLIGFIVNIAYFINSNRNLQNELSSIKDEMQSIQNQLTEKESALTNTAEKLSEAETIISNYEITISELQTVNIELESTVANMEIQLSELQAEVDTKLAEQEQLKSMAGSSDNSSNTSNSNSNSNTGSSSSTGKTVNGKSLDEIKAALGNSLSDVEFKSERQQDEWGHGDYSGGENYHAY